MVRKTVIHLAAASALSLVLANHAIAEEHMDRQSGATGADPSAAATQQERKVSLVAGHNVVDAVDDVRETISDLAAAIINASETAEFAAWQPIKQPLEATRAELNRMEQRLDRKAEQTDSSWLNWLGDRDYSVTVKGEIAELGKSLEQIASLLEQSKEKPGLQVVTGHNVVDQVDDVRETVADLINAIGSAGPEWGWFEDEDQPFGNYQAQLDEMEQLLDRKAEMTDAEWDTWVGDVEFNTFVNQQVRTLAQMLNQVSERIVT